MKRPRTAAEAAARLAKRPMRAMRNQLVQPPSAQTLPPGVNAALQHGLRNPPKPDDRDAVANPHKVMQSQWRKWNGTARRAFNSLYSFMMNNQRLFVHPKAAVVELEHWKTTAWNAAWSAADAAMGVYAGDEMGHAESALTKTKTRGKRNDAPKPKPKAKTAKVKEQAGKFAKKK